MAAIVLVKNQVKMQTKILKINSKNPQISKIRQASKIIKSGNIVAFPTETVYGLGANALDSESVKKIFVAKGRPSDNPLIIHISDISDLKRLTVDIPITAYKLIRKFWPGPLTLVLKKSKIVPKITTGGINTVAVRMPENKIAKLLIHEAGTPLAAPSANISGRPSPTTSGHVLEDMNSKISMIIDGGKTEIGIESTVIDLSRKTPMLLRPGAVTLEQLQKVIGKISIHPSIQERKTKNIHRSPGMKYRHYSPNAKIILIEGSNDKVKDKTLQLLSEFKKQRKKIGVLSTTNTRYKSDMTVFLGKKLDRVASNLFKTFREFDGKQIDVILVQGISRKGLGLGIMNRLGKAAYKKIKIN
ncbi:MAG: L-threonylcarbamoyladenylate synthase [Nitrosarchaeum sp.]|jgi:L-threonylcarbamoyladenylate synthase|uniref:L-threonylcarbamoyladenylate synthase n=1 Tax=Nitrosarchaeum sp. TaxID=2026886 RepID=UPI002DECDDC9|nr:L-threonylcarbamoyladenylate synthase [Nitrosarchaeum sp.]MEC4848165.1 L-threonylcarbamoyladenylate synthase [Nitrosarchaeum sp.]